MKYTETVSEALQTLEGLQNELSLRLQKLSKDLSQSHSADSSEQAVERENDEVVEQLRDDTEHELLQVKHALQRAKEGNYKNCEKCGGEISPERLKALPYTTVCIVCAETSTPSNLS